MAVSEMQIEILLRPVIAEMERGFFKVADKLQRDQLAINVQEIEAGFRNGQKATLAQYAGLKYYKDDDPELRGIPQGARNMERAKLNKGVRDVLRAGRRPDPEAIVLWKSATETAAWKTLMALSCRVCFPSARIRFVGHPVMGVQGRRFHRRCSMSGMSQGGSRGCLPESGRCGLCRGISG